MNHLRLWAIALDKANIERIFRVANLLILAAFAVALTWFWTGLSTGFVSFIIAAITSVLLYPHIIVNACLALFRRGLVCQMIIFASTLFFPYFAGRYFFHSCVNTDPEKGLMLVSLVFFSGLEYSFYMFTVWIIAFLLSEKRGRG